MPGRKKINVVVAVDKFKGSLTSFEACKAIEEGISRADSDVEVLSFPMADGGDGFATVMQYYLQTSPVSCDTVDPLGRKITASYQWQEATATAIIETAAASGLVLLDKHEYDPLKASTYGTGLLLLDAVRRGARKIILGLGGSATNDGGTGILQAFGFGFFDAGGNKLEASGEALIHINQIESPADFQLPEIAGLMLDIACDVRNPLYGNNGAAHVYAPQKGADPRAVELLDTGLKNFAAVLLRQTGKDVAVIPGSGAAGGIAAGLLAFFNVRMEQGIDLIVAHSRIEDRLPTTDLLITGEGKIDSQSGEGKVVGRMAQLAGGHGIPVIGICGIAELDEQGVQSLGLRNVVPLCTDRAQTAACMENAFRLLLERSEHLVRGFRIAEH